MKKIQNRGEKGGKDRNNFGRTLAPPFPESGRRSASSVRVGFQPKTTNPPHRDNLSTIWVWVAHISPISAYLPNMEHMDTEKDAKLHSKRIPCVPISNQSSAFHRLFTLTHICSQTVVCLYISLFPGRQSFVRSCILSFVCLFVCSLAHSQTVVCSAWIEIHLHSVDWISTEVKRSLFPDHFPMLGKFIVPSCVPRELRPIEAWGADDYCAGTTKPDYYATTAPGQGLTEGSNKLGPKLNMEQDQFWDRNQDDCIDSLALTTITKTSAQSSCLFSWSTHS